jgi:prepilin-type N-terminal cleavage/methylation domain-containing protein
MKKTDEPSLIPMCKPLQKSAGFSLVELLVTLSIIAILFSVMLPSLRGVRGAAEKLMCSNNMRSIYYALGEYANDNTHSPLPYSANHEAKLFQETMSLTAINPDEGRNLQWDGLGLLWRNKNMSRYLDNCKCLYCPSHHGAHQYQKYQSVLNPSEVSNETGSQLASNRYDLAPVTKSHIYSNYQYAGGVDPRTKKRISFASSNQQNTVLLSDGMRTMDDFNHTIGGNTLCASGEIKWFSLKRTNGKINGTLPSGIISSNEQESIFSFLWTSIQTEVTR